MADGKKPVDFHLNLVPCIDLLSVLITFLLMTSVWTQVGKMDVKQTPAEAGPEVVEPDTRRLKLAVFVKLDGYTVTTRGEVLKHIAKRADAYDLEALALVLQQVRREHPENREVALNVEDQVPYQDLISVMDVALENELTDIAVDGT